MAFREPLSVGVDDEWDMQVRGPPEAQEFLQVDLARGRGEEIIAAHHLRHTLRGVVDDDGEVVRRDAVIASQHDIIDEAGHRAVDAIVEDNLMAIGPQTQGRPAARLEPLGPLAPGQLAAGSGVRTRRAVRGVGRRLDLVSDLTSAAEALVDESTPGKVVDGRLVQVETVALADHLTVPVEAQFSEIAQLVRFDGEARLVAIEVLHADHEIVASRPRRQPGDRGRPEVAEVQISGRRRGEASGHSTSVARPRLDSIHSTSTRRPQGRAPDPPPISYSRHMVCPGCDTEVAEHQKFCHECGAPIEAAPLPEPTSAADVEQPPTEPIELIEPIEQPPTEPIELIEPIEQPPTEPIELIEPIEQPPTEPIELIEPADHGDITDPLDVSVDAAATTEMAEFAAPTEPLQLTSPPTTGLAEPPWFPETQAEGTVEMPAVFDGQGDLIEYPAAREPFRLRVVFLLALFGAAAMLMTIVADVIDIRTTRPAPGIATGVLTLEDLGSDLGLAGFIGTAVMVIGGLLACFGLRWGAGLAGGAGLAVAGWAGLSIGLAELPIAIAESITRTSSIEFTLRVTRDLGWWLIVGVGVIGFVVFLASLRSIGSGGRAALNPLIAAITAVAMVVLAFGPLVPVNDAVFADNFRSVDPTRDLPAAFFAGRLGQVGLIALAGVAGMLIVRSYGLGLAAGGVTVPFWLWIASLAQIGSNPVGIADRNPGADDTVPHAVTTVGMVATLVLLVLAGGLATYRLNRRRPA